MRHRFYGQNIDKPLSLTHNKPQWNSSTIGKLYHQTNGTVYIRELQEQEQKSPYAWRVVDAYYSPEDGIVSYFRAYDLDGSPIAHPVFGITWDGCEHQISGGFRFRPAANNYYVPVENNFVTHATGGYSVQVLDLDYPSEMLSFGLLKTNDHHGIVVSFRLFEIRPGYPNDLED